MRKQVKVKPNAKQQAVKEATDGSLIVYLKSPPVDGKANQELIEVLANYFQVAKSHVVIQRGMTARIKVVDIETT